MLCSCYKYIVVLCYWEEMSSFINVYIWSVKGEKQPFESLDKAIPLIQKQLQVLIMALTEVENNQIVLSVKSVPVSLRAVQCPVLVASLQALGQHFVLSVLTKQILCEFCMKHIHGVAINIISWLRGKSWIEVPDCNGKAQPGIYTS